MPVPISISELSTTPGSNSPSGADSPSVLDDHQRTAYAFIRTLSDTKAATADAVLLAGAQTVPGIKTFSNGLIGNVTGNASGTAANVTGTVALANGGTGQTTAAAAFNAIKQLATETSSGVAEKATIAEAQALASNDPFITPGLLAEAFKGANQSLNSTGYQRFPGGLIAQWGNVSAVVGSNTVTYPLAFPNAAFVVVATAGGNNGGNNTTSYVDGIGLANFNLVNASGTTNNWKYIALGR